MVHHLVRERSGGLRRETLAGDANRRRRRIRNIRKRDGERIPVPRIRRFRKRRELGGDVGALRGERGVVSRVVRGERLGDGSPRARLRRVLDGDVRFRNEHAADEHATNVDGFRRREFNVHGGEPVDVRRSRAARVHAPGFLRHAQRRRGGAKTSAGEVRRARRRRSGKTTMSRVGATRASKFTRRVALAPARGAAASTRARRRRVGRRVRRPFG